MNSKLIFYQNKKEYSNIQKSSLNQNIFNKTKLNINMKKNDKKGAFKKNEPVFDPDLYEEE